MSPFYSYSYNFVLFFVIFLIPIYPVLASFVHSNTVIEFYRGEIDESSILESYTSSGSSDDESIIIENKDSYLSINTLLDENRDISGETDIIDYEVQSWESISSIAYKFRISNNSIYWANNFSANATLKPGQIIKVPPVSWVVHKVKSWDTLTSLAEKYDISEEVIKNQNDLSEDGILVKWDFILIPGGIKKIESIPDDTKLLAKNDTKTNISKTKTPTKSKKSTISEKKWDYVVSKKWGAKWFAWGNCTYYVAMNKKNVNWRGNANQWLKNAAAKGHPTGSKASPWAIIVFSGRWYNPRYWHVGIVTSVKDDHIIVKDMNYRALNEVTVRKISKDDRSIRWYIYVD